MAANIASLLGLLILALSWLSYDHYRPWVAFHAEAQAITGCLLIALGLNGAIKRLPVVAIVIACISLLPWFQYFGGLVPFVGDAFIASAYILVLALAVTVGFAASRCRTRTVQLLATIWVPAIVSCGIGLAQWFGVQDALAMYAVQTDPGDRAMGNLGQPNQLATLLLMAGAVVVAIHALKSLSAPVTIIVLIFLSVGLALTQSRTGLVSVAGMTAVVAYARHKKYVTTSYVAVFLWLPFIAILYAAVPMASDLLLIGAESRLRASDPARIMIWKQAIAAIAEAPWVGYGWNMTSAAHAIGGLSHPYSLTYTNTHNLLLDLMLWNGIPTALIIAAICIWWMISALHTEVQPTSIFLIAALLPVFIHSLFEYPFAYAYFLVAVGILVGLISGLGAFQSSTSIPRVPFIASVAVSIIALIFIVLDYLKVERDFAVVRFENLRIGRTPNDYTVPNVKILTHLGAMLEVARIQPARGMRLEVLNQMAEVTQRFSYGPLHFRYAFSLGINGRQQESVRQLQIIRGMFGEGYYLACMAVIRERSLEFPELRNLHY